MFECVTQHQFWGVLVLALLLSASACAARYTVHPGALNTTDSAAYDALLAAETAIDQAKIENQGKPNDALNRLIASYDVARDSWLTYRGAIAAQRKRDSAQPQVTTVPLQAYLHKLSKNLSDLTNAIRTLKEAK